MTQEAPRVIGFPDDAPSLRRHAADELTDLFWKVGKLVNHTCLVAWLHFWAAAGYRPGLLPRVSVAGLAAILKVSRGQATRIVDALVDANLIARTGRTGGNKGGVALQVLDPHAAMSDELRLVAPEHSANRLLFHDDSGAALRADTPARSAAPGDGGIDYYQPSPAQRCASATTPAQIEVAWVGVRERLFRLRVRHRQAADDAHARGLSPEQANAIIDHFEAHPDAWQVGMLVHRLQNAHPDEDASEGWPEPAPTYRARVRRETATKSQNARAAEDAENRRKSANERERRAQLECDYGSRLDSLSEEQVESLIAQTTWARIPADFRRASRAVIRVDLLELLAKRDPLQQARPPPEAR